MMPEKRASSLIERRYAEVRMTVACAARDLFLETHSTSVTVECIAQRAGVSVRTFYRHFTTREEVINPLFEQSAEQLADRLDAAHGSDDIVVELVDVLTGDMATSTDEWRELLQLILTDPGYRLRWENTEIGLVDSLSTFLERRSVHADDAYVRRVIAQLVLTASRAAYTEWILDHRDSHLSDLQNLHTRTLTAIADGWRPRPA